MNSGYNNGLSILDSLFNVLDSIDSVSSGDVKFCSLAPSRREETAWPEAQPFWASDSSAYPFTIGTITDWPIRIEDPIIRSILIGEPSNKLPNALVSSAYPPSNISIGKDKSYHIQVACAGYNKESIALSFEDGYLVAAFTGDPISAGLDKAMILQRGIKAREDFDLKFLIDTRRYDVDQISSTIEDGLLEIVIPAIPPKKLEFSIKPRKPLPQEEISES